MLNRIDEYPNIIILDYRLPDMEGIELLKKIREQSPNTKVIVLSAQNSVKVTSELFGLGIFDYIIKDESALERLWLSAHKASATIEMSNEIHNLISGLNSSYNLTHTMKGASEKMDHVFSKISKTLSSNIPVSIQGETGTGKELVAKAIHYNSTRNKKPFIASNLSSIPKNLIESELFGHEKGAFTGAVSKRTGILSSAKGGTLFLDEIAEIPKNIQVKLLRVLQEMEMSLVGSNEKIKLDFRLITATHKNLAEEVKKGSLRRDFYFRIKGINITIPPLRERGKDIIILANDFINDFAKENNFPQKKLAKDAVNRLMNYNFPGNVRELKSLMQTSFVLSDGEII